MKSAYTVRSLWLSTLLLASAAAVPAFAQVNFNIRIGPPVQQVEVVPALAPGYVWAPGYWAWHSDRYVWVHGRSVYQRQGYRWAPDRWEQRNDMYYRHPGKWERDHDDDHDNGRGKHKGRGHDKHDKGQDHK